MLKSMSLPNTLGNLQPCLPVSHPFGPACVSSAAHMRRGGTNICSCAQHQQHDSTAEGRSGALHRRAVLNAAVSVAAVIAAAPATAVVEGYTPMTSLKGKDYGKARMRYHNICRSNCTKYHLLDYIYASAGRSQLLVLHGANGCSCTWCLQLQRLREDGQRSAVL
jgi:hypothetical protein